MKTIAYPFFLLVSILATSNALGACPDYTAPACIAGEGVVMGKDQSKCPMPMCQKITEKCPAYPALACEGDRKLSLTVDPKNKKCQMAVCK